MLKQNLMLAALTLGAASSLAPAGSPPPLCRVVIYTDYFAGVGYYAVPQLAPECSDNAVGRLRKSSTLNVKTQGASFQPIRPLKGAWNVSFFADDVPNREQFVYLFSSWQWQWYDGQRWLPAAIQ